MSRLILNDGPEEAKRLVAAAAAEGLIIRLLGGLAIRLHSPSATHRSLARSYPDLDFVTAEKRADRLEKFFGAQGYDPNKSFNLFNGDRRLLFYDEPNSRQIDVFVARFHMCHTVPITERLAHDPLTLPLAELLLTKMQIVEMNEKDIRDVCALLLDHPVGATDDETINLPHLARVCAAEWGLWKTVTVSAQKVREVSRSLALEPDQQAKLEQNLAALERGLAEAPKSLQWRVRDRVGERVKWYELPEEVKRG
jgi:hypothetical protein